MKKENAVGVILSGFTLIAMLISGCSTTGTNSQNSGYYDVENVESLAVPDVDLRGKNYVITSAMQNIGDEDLEFKTAARYVRNALSQKGYKQVASKEDADLLVRLAYGAGTPQTTTSAYTAAPGYSYPVGFWWYSIPPATRTVQITNCLFSIVLEAYDLKTPGRLPQIWKTTLTNTMNQEPLRGSLALVAQVPDMIAAAVPYFGTSMRQSGVPISDNTPMAIAVKRE